jgi:hypothetical protein
MNFHKRSVLLFWVVLLLPVFSAYAADLTLFVGGLKPGKLSQQGAEIPLDSGPVYGVRAAMNFVPMLGMEHTLGFSGDFLFPSKSTAITDAKGFIYSGNLIINIPAGHTVPYVTAGVGMLRQYGSTSLPLGTKFAFNYGGGLKFPRLFGPLGLRFDVRGYSTSNVISNKLNMLEVTGGLLISLGK